MSAPICPTAGEDLVAFVDGELRGAERARIEDHVTTCLTCRRESERLTKLSRLLSELPRVEPSAGFDAGMWRRLGREMPVEPRGGRARAARWSMPVLAAAAVLALALYGALSLSGPRETLVPRGKGNVASVPRDRVARGRSETADGASVASAPGEGRPEEAHLASADLAPEDIPPELVEHPELFLRFPGVRRLQKLEHFEEVRKPDDSEPVGRVAPDGRAFG